MKKIVIISLVLLALPFVTYAGSIPDTGQTQCFDNTQEITCPNPGEPFYGQDAQYGDNTQHFTKLDANGDDLPSDTPWPWAMVKDNVTGLIWEVKEPGDVTPDYNNPHDADNYYFFYDGVTGTPGNGIGFFDTEQHFINKLNTMEFGGFDNWRIPDANELTQLVDRGKNVVPRINSDYFPNTINVGHYWTSTINDLNVEVVDFEHGWTLSQNSAQYGYGRAVRGESSVTNLVDNDDGTVTDYSVSLMWQQDGLTQTDWSGALSYCEDLILAGYEDWKLPNINEAHTIVDYGSPSPKIDTNYFPNPGNHYWSSTTVGTLLVPFINLDTGNVSTLPDKSLSAYVRCVRGCFDDLDCDGVQDFQDNCPATPNGPNGGTCTEGDIGIACLDSEECGTDGNCSSNQEDFDNDGLGDACDVSQICRGNFDFDGDVDGSDASEFKKHFGRSGFKNPCPPIGPAPVERTWQTISDASYDDGYYQKGIGWPEPRFTDNSDGTVRDNLTGLIWLQHASCFDQKTWDLTLLDCNGLADGQCELTDSSTAGEWRLPNINELFSLIDHGQSDPALPSEHYFTNEDSLDYWSSTAVANTNEAWAIDMENGAVLPSAKSYNRFIWCVKGGH